MFCVLSPKNNPPLHDTISTSSHANFCVSGICSAGIHRTGATCCYVLLAVCLLAGHRIRKSRLDWTFSCWYSARQRRTEAGFDSTTGWRDLLNRLRCRSSHLRANTLSFVKDGHMAKGGGKTEQTEACMVWLARKAGGHSFDMMMMDTTSSSRRK